MTAIITLSDQDTEAFKLFMQHYDKIKFMLDSGVFSDIKRGSATINFDKNGDILLIERHLYTYSPKSDKFSVV